MSRLILTLLLLVSSCCSQITNAEFADRRSRAMDVLKDGILFVQANNAFSLFEPGFQQRPDFYYFTGLSNSVSAILAVDGQKRESWLFVPHKLSGATGMVTSQQSAPSSN